MPTNTKAPTLTRRGVSPPAALGLNFSKSLGRAKEKGILSEGGGPQETVFGGESEAGDD
jgi:hypothetical protein